MIKDIESRGGQETYERLLPTFINIKKNWSIKKMCDNQKNETLNSLSKPHPV